MLQTLDGRPYDNDRWGAYYRPYGLEAPAGAAPAAQTETVSTVSPASAPAASNTDAPWEEDAPAVAADPVVVPQGSTSSDKAQDILAMIRARQSK